MPCLTSLIAGAEFCHLRIGRLSALFRSKGTGDKVISYSPLLTMLLVTLAGVDDLQEDSSTDTSSSSRSESEMFLRSLVGEYRLVSSSGFVRSVKHWELSQSRDGVLSASEDPSKSRSSPSLTDGVIEQTETGDGISMKAVLRVLVGDDSGDAYSDESKTLW